MGRVVQTAKKSKEKIILPPKKVQKVTSKQNQKSGIEVVKSMIGRGKNIAIDKSKIKNIINRKKNVPNNDDDTIIESPEEHEKKKVMHRYQKSPAKMIIEGQKLAQRTKRETMIPKAVFARLVREVLQKTSSEDHYVQRTTFQALQEIAEKNLIELFETASRLTQHRGKQTTSLSDFKFACDLLEEAAAKRKSPTVLEANFQLDNELRIRGATLATTKRSNIKKILEREPTHHEKLGYAMRIMKAYEISDKPQELPDRKSKSNNADDEDDEEDEEDFDPKKAKAEDDSEDLSDNESEKTKDDDVESSF